MKDVIVVDAGHGGADNGAVWGFAEEDDINLSVAYLLRCELRFRGFNVVMTRERDEYVSLVERVEVARKAQADLFVSIHCDAYHTTTVKGISTHVYPKCSQRTWNCAKSIQTVLLQRFPEHLNRGVKQSDFYVLRKTLMSAVLVECEFLSNTGTRKFLREPENQLGLAQAIANGVRGGCGF